MHGRVDCFVKGRHTHTTFEDSHPHHGQTWRYASSRHLYASFDDESVFDYGAEKSIRYSAVALWRRARWFVFRVGRICMWVRFLYAKAQRRQVKEKPRLCSSCGVEKRIEAFSPSQWKKAKAKGGRVCIECQSAAQEREAEARRKQAEEEARRKEEQLREEEHHRNECAICLEEEIPMSFRSVLPCMHWVCSACASRMFAHDKLTRCPICRFKVEEPRRQLH